MNDTANLTDRLPAPDDIHRRIEACQAELAALRKLLRVSVTAHRAEEARRQRQPTDAATRPAKRGAR
jgi:hypothetical protein